MNEPTTPAGRWLVDRSQWDDGQRAFRVRINATAGPDDMHRHVLAIEKEAAAAALRRVEDLEAEVRKWKAIATQYNTQGTTLGRGTRP
jgi:hypothetical protein